jgi:hypothetical protein
VRSAGLLYEGIGRPSPAIERDPSAPVGGEAAG